MKANARPPTKLGEGYVLTGVCQSFCPGGGYLWSHVFSWGGVGMSGGYQVLLGVSMSGTRSLPGVGMSGGGGGSGYVWKTCYLQL